MVTEAPDALKSPPGPATESASPLRPAAFGRIDWLKLWIVLGAYAAVLALVVPRHEPWFDEAQAWLIARDDSPYNLLVHTLRYEGTPGLWHLLLMAPAKAGLPYAALNWLAAAVAVAGVFVFLRFAPFPWPIKALFPFTYYVLYQYGVIARSYSLLPVLLFGLAALYRRKAERIYCYTALLCLLANVSLHGALIAGSLMLIHLVQVRSQWDGLSPAFRARQLRAAAAFGLLGVLLVWQLYPPPDPGFEASREIHTDFLDVSIRACMVLARSFTGILVVSAVALAVSLWWLRHRGVLAVYLLPAGTVLLFFAVKYCTVFHEGILFLIWVFALWIGFDSPRRPAQDPRGPMVLVMLLMVAVFICQITWSIRTTALDYSGAYSGARELAQYIQRERLQGRVIFAHGFQTFAVQPYFDRNLFDNYNNKQGPAFWLWSSRHRPIPSLADIRQGDPDVIVIAVWNVWTSKQEQLPNRPGYTQVGVFEGRLFYKGDDYYGHDSFLVLRKSGG